MKFCCILLIVYIFELIMHGYTNIKKLKSIFVLVELTLSDNKSTTIHKVNNKATSNYNTFLA